MSLNEVSKILNQKTIFPTIKSLLSRKVILLIEELNEQYKPKSVRLVSCLNKDIDFKRTNEKNSDIDIDDEMVKVLGLQRAAVHKMLPLRLSFWGRFLNM